MSHGEIHRLSLFWLNMAVISFSSNWQSGDDNGTQFYSEPQLHSQFRQQTFWLFSIVLRMGMACQFGIMIIVFPHKLVVCISPRYLHIIPIQNVYSESMGLLIAVNIKENVVRIDFNPVVVLFTPTQKVADELSVKGRELLFIYKPRLPWPSRHSLVTCVACCCVLWRGRWRDRNDVNRDATVAYFLAKTLNYTNNRLTRMMSAQFDATTANYTQGNWGHLPK